MFGHQASGEGVVRVLCDQRRADVRCRHVQLLRGDSIVDVRADLLRYAQDIDACQAL
jgi:hypothetical protein